MKSAHRITLAAFALVSLGATQAAEVTEFRPAASTLSRAQVQAEARTAQAMPGELYDGMHKDARLPKATALTRAEVRMQARSARTRSDDYIGG